LAEHAGDWRSSGDLSTADTARRQRHYSIIRHKLRLDAYKCEDGNVPKEVNG
jgi:hypothetical protein